MTVPNDLSLLLCARRAIADLVPAIAQEEHRALLQTVEVVLNESLLRQNSSFDLEHYREGVALVRAGVSLGLGEAGILAELPDRLDSNISARVLGEQLQRVTGILESFVRDASAPGEEP